MQQCKVLTVHSDFGFNISRYLDDVNQYLHDVNIDNLTHASSLNIMWFSLHLGLKILCTHVFSSKQRRKWQNFYFVQPNLPQTHPVISLSHSKQKCVLETWKSLTWRRISFHFVIAEIFSTLTFFEKNGKQFKE